MAALLPAASKLAGLRPRALLKEGTDFSVRGSGLIATRRRQRSCLGRIQLSLPGVPALLHFRCYATHVCQHLPCHCTSSPGDRGQRLQEGQYVLRQLPPCQYAQSLQNKAEGKRVGVGRGELASGGHGASLITTHKTPPLWPGKRPAD